MNLKRQLLLVSLLTLVLPWAGCQFIRETESALRSGQQQMLAGTARAIAESMAQHEDEFPLVDQGGQPASDSLYGHRIPSTPNIDGYFDDWNLSRDALRSMRGADGSIRFAIGLHELFVYLYVEVADKQVVYSSPGTAAVDDSSRFFNRVGLVNTSPPYLDETLIFSAEAPGTIIIDTDKKYLFYVNSGNSATRYGIGVGREGFGWNGSVKIQRKAEWPNWTPPPAMRSRERAKGNILPASMKGGINNPLGARAMYLYKGGNDTMYRIHGTNEPWTIGMNVSSGCIRLENKDVEDLYRKAKRPWMCPCWYNVSS